MQSRAEQSKSNVSLAFPLGLQQRGLCNKQSNNLDQKRKTEKRRKEKDQRNKRVDEERDPKKKMKKREEARKMDILSSHPPWE
jgi:hypothetical protein